MRSTTDHFKAAKSEQQRVELSKGIAKFSAHAVREDRVHRAPYDGLAKLCDVLFNGRPA